MKLGMWLWLLPRNIAIATMKIYRKLVSPLYGQVCRYWPTCSRYSLEAYQNRGFVIGLGLTVWRLLRCNPWSNGGVDDPPPLRKSQLVLNRYGFIVWDPAHTSETLKEEG